MVTLYINKHVLDTDKISLDYTFKNATSQNFGTFIASIAAFAAKAAWFGTVSCITNESSIE